MIDVTDLCSDRSSAHKGGVNPEIWYENVVRIGFRLPDRILLDHPMFFLKHDRIIKYHDDEFQRLRGQS